MDSLPTTDAWRPEIVPGDRIFLSTVLRDDVPTLTRWFSDLELTAYLGMLGRAFTIEQEQDWFALVSKDSANPTFAIVLREGRHLIGTIGLMHVNYQRGVAELGITIGDKAAWGQGYGAEAVRLMCDYGFTFLSLRTIYLWHVAFNERAHHAYIKAGFKLAGRLRDGYVFNGQHYDNIMMDITRADLGPSRLVPLIDQLRGA